MKRVSICLLVLFICITLGVNYKLEFDQVKAAVLEKMRFYSPGLDGNIENYFCPQGLPGFAGMMGESGETQINFYIDPLELQHHHNIDPYECDVQSAVQYVLNKLDSYKVYKSTMPSGMPGIMGLKGRSSQQQLTHIVKTNCFQRHFNTTQPCLTAMDVYLDILKTFETPIQCPNKLVGPIGKQGPIGEPGILPLKHDELEQYLDTICPLLLE